MVSGSPIIRNLRQENQNFFDYLVFLPQGPTRSTKDGLEWVAIAREEFEKEALEEREDDEETIE